MFPHFKERQVGDAVKCFTEPISAMHLLWQPVVRFVRCFADNEIWRPYNCVTTHRVGKGKRGQKRDGNWRIHRLRRRYRKFPVSTLAIESVPIVGSIFVLSLLV